MRGDLFAVFEFSLGVTGPICLVLVAGVVVRRLGWIGETFVLEGSRLVFRAALPALLFSSILTAQWSVRDVGGLVLFGLAATVVYFVFLEWLAGRVVTPRRDRGVVVQGAFRANMGIIGLAYCLNAYGQAGMATTALYLGTVTLLFNVLAVITLSRSLAGSPSVARVGREILRNPLIQAIGLAMVCSGLGWRPPEVALRAVGYLGDMTIALALLCTGAALDFHTLRGEWRNTVLAVAGKTVLTPLLFTVGGALCGFRGMELGILFLLMSAPSAAAGYAMVCAMGGNAVLAANIVALTTLLSLFTTSLGTLVLRGLGWI